jgi:hypothetical protein
MDINYNSDILDNIYLDNIQHYVLINEEMYENIIGSLGLNYLLILFTISCFTGFVCCIKKPKNDYVLIQNASLIEGKIVDKV